MKKVVNGMMYNTETAEFIGEVSSECGQGDFNWFSECLYKTKKVTTSSRGKVLV